MPNSLLVSSFRYAPVPDRASLHRRFQTAQRYAVYGEFALWGLLIVCLFGIDWSAAYRDALHSAIVLAVFPVQLLPGLIKTLTKKKKRIEELSESSRFGIFDKHLLRRTTQDVLDKLGIQKEHVNVFITADKDLNAFAVNVGLSRFFPQFRGIYLNRQTLHMLSPDELRSWIGHELGHLFPYAIRADQSIGLRLIVGSLLPLLIFQWVGFRNGLGFMIVFAVCGAFLAATSWTRSRLSQVVEYLCDEVGCFAAGANAAVTDLVRASRESLAKFNLLMYVKQLAAEGKIASEQDALRVYEEALGYGATDIEGTQKQIHDLVRQRRQRNGGLSLRGLIDFIWNDPSADSPAAEVREELKQMHKILQRLPTVDWFSEIDWDGKSIMRDDQLDDLVEALIRSPDRLLVPLIEEAQADEDLTHPSFRNRIIYLWVHREAIAKQAF